MFRIIGCKDLCKTFASEVSISLFFYFPLQNSSLCSSIPACRDTVDALFHSTENCEDCKVWQEDYEIILISGCFSRTSCTERYGKRLLDFSIVTSEWKALTNTWFSHQVIPETPDHCFTVKPCIGHCGASGFFVSVGFADMWYALVIIKCQMQLARLSLNSLPACT